MVNSQIPAQMIKQKSPLLAAALFATLLVVFRLTLDYLADGNLHVGDFFNYVLVGAIAAVPMYFLFKSQLLKTDA